MRHTRSASLYLTQRLPMVSGDANRRRLAGAANESPHRRRRLSRLSESGPRRKASPPDRHLCFCGSEHFLHRTVRLRTCAPQREHRWYLACLFFFLRGRNGTTHLGTVLSFHWERRPVVAR